MSKRKTLKKTTQQPLNPKEFIRTKARLFPIYKCWINTNWKEQGLANVIVSRIQPNGNFTFAIYLVDLYCLGIKDTFFNMNLDKPMFENFVRNFNDHNQMEEIEYVLAHNIIFASIEYAEELGLYPHQDFIFTTKYIIEEDTDDIEYIEIECGDNGRPHFVMSDFYNNAQKKAIINQLNKSVGSGNFDVSEFEVFDDELWEEDLDDLSPEERKSLFTELVSNEEDLIKDENFNKIIELTNSIYINDLCDLDKVDELFDEWDEEIDLEVDDSDFLIESFGMESNLFQNDEDVKMLQKFENNIVHDESNNLLINKIVEKHPNIPYFRFIEIILLTKQEKFNDLNLKINEYIQLFPNYALLKIEFYKNQIRNHKKLKSTDISFQKIFINRTGITHFEMVQYQILKQNVEIKPKAFDAMQALTELYEILDLEKEYLETLNIILQNSKINYLKEHFNIQS